MRKVYCDAHQASNVLFFSIQKCIIMCSSIYVHLRRKNNTVGNEGKHERGVICCLSFHPETWQRKKIKWRQKNHDDHKSVNQQLKKNIKILLKRVSSTPLTLNMQSVFMFFESNIRFIPNCPLCRAIMTLPPTPISQLDSCNNFRSSIPASPFSFWKLFATWQWKPPRWNGIMLSAKDKACHSPAQ